MNTILNRDLILEANVATDIHPAFIEKDWYGVQLLKVLSTFENNHGVELVFAGGTCLSKGSGLLNRFSEDLDFILSPSEHVTVSGRRAFRRSVITHILKDPRFRIERDEVERGHKNRFFRMKVYCDMEYEHKSLRPYLLLEMTFADLRLPTSIQNIQSVLSEFASEAAETQLTCISPIETASDKISALTWRVLARDRSSDRDDPTMVRHLHDLAALKPLIIENKEVYTNCAQQSLQRDQEKKRGGATIASMSIPDRFAKAYEMLVGDAIYREEYDLFVQRMSHAAHDERISFDEALVTLKEIMDILV